MKRATLDALNAARRDKRAAVLAKHLKTGAEQLLFPDETALAIDGIEIGAAVRDAVRADRSTTVDTPAGPVFLNVFNPPLRLIVVGAVHIAQALAPTASGAGYDVTIVDPRGAFAAHDRFAGVRLVDDWPDDFLDREPADARTAVVTLTHDPKLDDAALDRALASPAFYIGSLGSRKTHAARLERLSARGFDDAALARIHGPIGLAIGARSPAEIAIAVLAQITQVLRAPLR